MPDMGGGGGGGSSAPTQSTVTQTNIPEYARPYVETMLGATQQQLFNTEQTPEGTTQITGVKPYVPYSTNPADYVAGFSPLQQQAQQGVAGLQLPGEFGAASQATAAATAGALGTQYDPSMFFAQQVRAPRLQQYQMAQPQQVGTQSFLGGDTAESYMSPYMQNVVNAQQREARRASDIMGTQQAAQATQAGAFGGARQGIVEAERQRNLATQLGDIQAAGLQSAYSQGQQQFNVEQQARMQAALANQQAGLTAAQANLQSLLGTQQLGAGQRLQAQQLNQAANLQAQQLAEQSRQYGAGLGLQGLQTGLQGAGQLANIGGQGLQAQQGILGLQAQTGAQQQQQQQNIINQAIQNYATAQQYPQQQLAFMSAMLRGLPLQTQTVQGYQAAPSYLSQAAGLGTTGIAGLGLYNAMNRGYP